jgi:hypothetical protein
VKTEKKLKMNLLHLLYKCHTEFLSFLVIELLKLDLEMYNYLDFVFVFLAL